MRRSTAISLAVALIASLFVGLAGADALADVSVSASVEPSVASVGDQVTLTVTVNGKFRRTSKPELPPLDDFYVYESGSSQSFNFVNGSFSASLTFTYLLVPQKEGTFTISPIKYRVGDKEYTAAPVKLEVVSGGQAPPPTASGREEEPEETVEPAGKHLFVRASVDRDTVYVNQQITWTLRFYMDPRVRMLRSPSFSPPEAQGFWVEDLPPQRNYSRTIDGRRFAVSELKRAYFATAPGEYTIGPAEVTVTLDDFGFSSWDDLFNRPFDSFGFGKPVRLRTKGRKIVVLPLPEKGKPAGFSGIVAHDLKLKLDLDKQVVQVGEPINLKLELEGEGNMKTAAAPELPDLPDFKVYQSGSSSDVFKKNYVVSGRKKYEYVLVPKAAGPKTLKSIRLSYFDPVEGRYALARTRSARLDVKPGSAEEQRRVIIAGSGDEIEVLGRDIRYIHPVPAEIGIGDGALYANKLYLSLHAVPFLAVVFCLISERRKKRWREDIPRARAERALREAEKKLSAAGKLVAKGEVERGLGQIAVAIDNYFADKTNVSAAGLTFDEIEKYLHGHGVSEDRVRELRSILDTCDAARYAGSSLDDRAAGETAKRAAEVLRDIEKRCRR